MGDRFEVNGDQTPGTGGSKHLGVGPSHRKGKGGKSRASAVCILGTLILALEKARSGIDMFIYPLPPSVWSFGSHERFIALIHASLGPLDAGRRLELYKPLFLSQRSHVDRGIEGADLERRLSARNLFAACSLGILVN